MKHLNNDNAPLLAFEVLCDDGKMPHRNHARGAPHIRARSAPLVPVPSE